MQYRKHAKFPDATRTVCDKPHRDDISCLAREQLGRCAREKFASGHTGIATTYKRNGCSSGRLVGLLT